MLPAAVAYSLNVTVVGYDVAGGWVTAYSPRSTKPFVSTVNFGSGGPVANAAIVGSDFGGAINVYSSASTHLIIDINGYFAEPAGTITGVTAGAGLTGGGTQGDVPLAVDFAGSGVANTVARSDHKHYERTITVSPSGGGAGLRAALNGITDASAANPYLVKVEPGSYDVSVGCSLVMQPFVDLEGSGEGITLIHLAAICPVIVLADNSEVRSLTVEHDGAASGDGPHAGGAVGVGMFPGGAPRLSHVTIIANATAGGGTGASLNGGAGGALFTDVTILVNVPSGDLYGIKAGGSLTLDRVDIRVNGGNGIRNGILLDDGSGASKLTISRSSIVVQSATGGGTVSAISATSSQLAGGTATITEVQANASAPSGATVIGAQFNDVTATMSGSLVSASIGRGILLSGSKATPFTAESSRIVGPDNTVSAPSAAKTVRIASSRLDGGPVSAASATCAFVWDEAFAGYASTCP